MLSNEPKTFFPTYFEALYTNSEMIFSGLNDFRPDQKQLNFALRLKYIQKDLDQLKRFGPV